LTVAAHHGHAILAARHPAEEKPNPIRNAITALHAARYAKKSVCGMGSYFR
jgi:hypothetical protein